MSSLSSSVSAFSSTGDSSGCDLKLRPETTAAAATASPGSDGCGCAWRRLWLWPRPEAAAATKGNGCDGGGPLLLSPKRHCSWSPTSGTGKLFSDSMNYLSCPCDEMWCQENSVQLSSGEQFILFLWWHIYSVRLWLISIFCKTAKWLRAIADHSCWKPKQLKALASDLNHW
jgi:hypothetical protein